MVKQKFSIFMLCGSGLFLTASYVQGQVEIMTAELDPYRFTPSTFLTASINNQAAVDALRLEGEVRSGGDVILTFRTSQIQVTPGVNWITSGDYVMELYVYGQHGSVGIDGILPAGDYTYCLQAVSMGAEPSSEHCDVLVVDDIQAMDLLFPWNGDTIDEVRPTLSWMIAPGTLSPLHRARLTLVHMKGEEDAYASMTQETPLFQLPSVYPLVVPYPGGAMDLQSGQCYAWQVERLTDDRIIDRTEVWKFCVRKAEQLEGDKYVLLGGRHTNKVVTATNEKLFIRFDEVIGIDQLMCTVRLPLGGATTSNTSKDQEQDPILRSTGPGLFQIDLVPCALSPGQYVLDCRTMGGRREQLHFIIE